jgi:DNA-binding response OmpR family regulator
MARILVVDADQIVRHAVRIVLEAAGHDVMEAADAEAAGRLCGEQGADLVLVDYRPDGLEVIRALRAAIPRPQIVAMSGGGRIGHRDLLKAASALGVAYTLRKPFEPSDLLAAIRELLGGRGP